MPPDSANFFYKMYYVTTFSAIFVTIDIAPMRGHSSSSF